MAAGFDYLAQAGVRNAEAQVQDKRDQRNLQLQTALQNATTPEEQQAVIHDAYAKDPSKVKQFVENLGRRMVGKQPQEAASPYAAPPPVTPPAGPDGSSGELTSKQPAPRTKQEAFAGHAARGKLPAQQQQEQKQGAAQWQAGFDRSQTAPDLQAKVGAIKDVLTKAGVDPTVIQDAIGAAAGVPYKKPTADELTRQDYQSAMLAGQVPKDKSGVPLSYEAWKAAQSASGRAAGSPEKVPTMKPGTVNGENAFAYYSMDKKAWIDSNTGQPVHNFVPAPNFAQTGLYGLDTGYDGQGNPVPVLLNRRTGQVVPAPAGIVAPAQSKGIEGQRTAAIAGDSLLRTMLGASERAKSGDQQAMLLVVANHIGMTLGAQKGARINQAVWDEATESAPWLQNVEKAWGPDGYLQGVKLSPQQIDQMVELGKLRRDVMWEQASQTAQAAGVPLQVPQFSLHVGAPAPKAAQGGGAQKFSDGDKHYQIPADKVEAFKRAHPNATTE